MLVLTSHTAQEYSNNYSKWINPRRAKYVNILKMQMVVFVGRAVYLCCLRFRHLWILPISLVFSLEKKEKGSISQYSKVVNVASNRTRFRTQISSKGIGNNKVPMCGSTTRYKLINKFFSCSWLLKTSGNNSRWLSRLNSWTGIRMLLFEPSIIGQALSIENTCLTFPICRTPLTQHSDAEGKNTHAIIQSSPDWSLHPAAPAVLSLVPHQIWVSTWETRTASSPTRLDPACRPPSPGRSASARWCWSGVWPSQLGMRCPTVAGQPYC